MEESLDSIMVLEWARRVDVDDEDETGLQKKIAHFGAFCLKARMRYQMGEAASRKNGRKKKGNECR